MRDFLRKYKWRCIFSGRPSTAKRFNFASGAEPPAKLVPVHVQKKCDHIFYAVLSILKSCPSCFPADNLSTEQRQELERLRNDNSVTITPVDKGGKWMVVPSEEYAAEGLRQLSNAKFYKPIEEPLTVHTGRRLSNFLSFLHRTRFLSRRELNGFLPPESSKERHFYLLPKLHKDKWPSPLMPPGRPIVSDTDSVSRKCASLVEYFLNPIAQRTQSYVRDSLHVVSLLQDFHCETPFILFTFDIASLYTNVPIEEGVAAVGRAFLKHKDPQRPDLTILSLLRLLLTSNDFIFKNRRFLQTHGTAMGCAFGSSFANIFLAEWEAAIGQHHCTPVLWLRYIDDIFGIWTHGEEQLLVFKDYINSIHDSIKVTLTYSPVSIRFLDLELYSYHGRVLHRIGFKPTDSFSILSPNSFHPPHVFSSIIFSQVYRWASRSSTYEDFCKTKSIVQCHWRRQGYTRSCIRNTVKNVFEFTCQNPYEWSAGFYTCTSSCFICKYATPTFSVSNDVTSFPLTHRLTCSTVGVVYLITCVKCGVRYVGETSRTLRHRLSEHLQNIRSNASTSVAAHFTSSCALADFSFTAIEHQTNTRKRRKKESQWINRLQTQAPKGLNIVANSSDALRLVVPFSECSQRVTRLCQHEIRDVRTSAAYRSHRNLRSHLKTGH